MTSSTAPHTDRTPTGNNPRGGIVTYQPPPAQIRLTEHESASVAALALDLLSRHHGHQLHDDELLYSVEAAAGRMPGRLLTALRRFRDRGNTDGVLVVHGMPTESAVPTVCGHDLDDDWLRVPVATFAQLMAMSVLGPVVSYEDEKSGHLVQDVVPRPGEQARQENSGSVLLELHTEDGFLDHPPHYLSLLCLRSDHDRQAATLGCGIRRVLPLIPDDTLEVLREPRFQVAFSSSFTKGEDGWWSRPLAVLSGPGPDPTLTVDFHGMVGLDPEAQTALDGLRNLFLDNLVGAVLEPGQLMIVDNRLAVHGRTSFTPRFDEGDRWLRRCFSLSSIRDASSQIEYGRALRSAGLRSAQVDRTDTTPV